MVWSAPFLQAQVIIPAWVLVLVALAGWCVGMAIHGLLPRPKATSGPDLRMHKDINAVQTLSAESVPTLQEQAAAELNGVLAEIAQGKTQYLPQILGSLRYVFDRLGEHGSADWCRAELDGYTPGKTPDYRYADLKVSWRSPGGVSYVSTRTGEVVGRPPDRLESLPLNDPVGSLVRISQSGRTTPTGETHQGVLDVWREVVMISPRISPGSVAENPGRVLPQSFRRKPARSKIDSSPPYSLAERQSVDLPIEPTLESGTQQPHL